MHTVATTESSLQPAFQDRAHVQRRLAPQLQNPPGRLVSLDAYRGFVMLLMACDGLGIADYVRLGHRTAFWRALEFQTQHVAWRGCAMWDLIQPSFIFIVGVAIPYSLARRRYEGESFPAIFAHALFRSLVLICLGIFLRSLGQPQTLFTFQDTLTQIGLAYPFAFLLAWARPRWQAAAVALILVGYWLAFALYPLPSVGFNHRAVGLDQFWSDHVALHGFAAHWNKSANPAALFDLWFLNFFPKSRPFIFDPMGYQTLNFIPAVATMVLGILASNLIRGGETPRRKTLCLLAIAGIGCLAGNALDQTGICPIVKHIWTPAWVLYSGGWTFLFLAVFYALVDWGGYRRAAFPLAIFGMNSIAIYCLADPLAHPWFRDMLRGVFHTHLGPRFFQNVVGDYAPIAESAATLAIFWLIAVWMYRRRIFCRI